MNQYGQTQCTTTPPEYGCHPVEGHEAGDDCASWAVETGIQIQAEPQTAARAS